MSNYQSAGNCSLSPFLSLFLGLVVRVSSLGELSAFVAPQWSGTTGYRVQLRFTQFGPIGLFDVLILLSHFGRPFRVARFGMSSEILVRGLVVVKERKSKRIL